MPDPAAAAGESAADSQGEHSAAEGAPAAAALTAALDDAPQTPDLGAGTDISVDLAQESAESDEEVPASSDPAQMVADPTGLGGVGGEGGAG